MKRSTILLALPLLLLSVCGSRIVFCQSANVKQIDVLNNGNVRVVSLKGGRLIFADALNAGVVIRAPGVGDEIHFSSSTGILLYSSVGERYVPVDIGSADLVEEEELSPQSLPTEYAVLQNYPNPFNPTTTITFDLPEEAFVTLKVYNMLGQEVALLLDREMMDDGVQEIEFDAHNLASGMYFYRMVAQGIGDEEEGITGKYSAQTKRMLLIK